MTDPTLTPDPYPAPADPPTPTLRRLFLGDDGLRAGWSVLLFLILTIALFILVTIAAAHLLHPPKRNPHAPIVLTPRFSIANDSLSFAIPALVAWLMSFLERRPYARYGLSLRRALPDLLIGLFWGFLALSTLVGLLFLTRSLVFDGAALHGRIALTFAAKWALAFLFVGLSEEFLFRGYLQYTVARGVAGIARAMNPAQRHTHAIGFWVAAFLFSMLLFALLHTGNGGETALGILAVASAGTVFVFSLWRTGTLWWAIGFHTAWDWAQTFFYGTPDSALHAVGHFLNSHPTGSPTLSGGTAGPEGSILLFPVLILVALVIHFTLPRRNYPLTPDQSPPLQATPAPGLFNASPEPSPQIP